MSPNRHPAPTIPAPAIVLLVLIGALLRLGRFDLMAFNLDQVNTLITAEFWLRHGIPPVGLMSHFGVIMPPGYFYALSPVLVFTRSPVAVGLYIAVLDVLCVWLIYRLGTALDSPVTGFWAAALYAVHPWAVFYSRIIWPQSLLPVFVSLFLLTLISNERRRGRRAVFWLPLLAVILCLIHYSAAGALIVFVLWAATAIIGRRIRTGVFLAGLGAGALILVPFLWFLIHSRFSALRQLLGGTIGGKIPLVDNLAGLVVLFGRMAFAGGFGYAFSPSLMNTESLARTPLGEGKPLLNFLAVAATILTASLFVFGLGRFLKKLRKGGGEAPRAAAWFLLFTAIPPALYLGRGVKVPPWCFNVIFPAVAVISGAGLAQAAELLSSWRRGIFRPAAPVIGGFILISGVAVWLGLLGYLERTGGTAGMYGLTYGVQAAAADRLAGEGIPPGAIDASFTRDEGREIIYLYYRLAKAGRCGIIQPGKSARLIDTIRFPGERCSAGEEDATPEDAGPLKVCISVRPL